MSSRPVWAVAIYLEGGHQDGETIIEFVRADDRDEAVANAENLNDHMADALQICAAAQLPEEVL